MGQTDQAVAEWVQDLPPPVVETLRRQTIAFLYAIGRAEGVRYKVVTVEDDSPPLTNTEQ